MKGWRQRILNELNMCFERIAVAFDPDGLLREEKTANEIKKIGFDIVVFEDSIEFRYVYESRYRDAFEGAQTNDLIAQARKLLVVVPNPDDRRRVPFDVLSKAQEFSYGLADIFPQLSYNIVSQLELDQLDMLWDAVIRENPDRLGENFTKEFVMKHVFQMKLPDSLTSDEDLLVTLMDRHYKNLPIPEVLETWYIGALRREGLFSDWPIEILMSNRRSFLDFLQERWALFLERNMEIQVAEGYRVGTEETLLKIPGPIDIPFDSEDIRVRLDNFFLEGLLEPVPPDPSYYGRAGAIVVPWIRTGIRLDTEEMAIYEIERLLEICGDTLPEEDSSYDSWKIFSSRWTHLKASILSFPPESPQQSDARVPFSGSVDAESQKYGDYQQRMDVARSHFEELQTKLDSRFQTWMCNSFSSLHNLPAVQPVMVHHIPRYLARILRKSDDKLALIVLDGMACDQWLVIKDELSKCKSNITFRESSVFAWVPTLTPVSRRTIFAGKLPMYFGDGLKSTTQEKRFWTQFWVSEGLDEDLISYIFLPADRWIPDDLGKVDLTLDDEIKETTDFAGKSPKALGDKALLDQVLSSNVLGIVVGKIDRIGHGIQLGTEGFYNQVRQWVSQGYLLNLLEYLSNNGYRVFITSDHGNVEAQGMGRPKQGSIPETKGERAIIYNSQILLESGLREFPNAIPWEPVGLPDDYFPLLAPGRSAFSNVGATSVCHGGICIEEVIVPFAEVEFHRTSDEKVMGNEKERNVSNSC